jgi:hypothetical protein
MEKTGFNVKVVEFNSKMCYNKDNLNDNTNSNCYSNSSNIVINI